jgi:hypothetical protein
MQNKRRRNDAAAKRGFWSTATKESGCRRAHFPQDQYARGILSLSEK